jgi:pimeloyl-ACP methyl ester carboxylesterase/tetratricopeptide (TPR) repeat protein
VVDLDLVLIHGLMSSPDTWDRIIPRLSEDPDLAGLRIHPFGYESEKLAPGLGRRTPDYDDIAQSLPAFLAHHAPGTAPVAIVTHSQGGLILQRFLAWMLGEGRGRELGRIRCIVLLACPNEGTEYQKAFRAAVGLDRHPQAGQLRPLNWDVTEARRIVLRQIVNATSVDDRHCPIPVHVYAGRSDKVVPRGTSQSVFPKAEVLPGDHFTILDPGSKGNLTVPTLKRHLLEVANQGDADAERPDRPAPGTPDVSGPEGPPEANSPVEAKKSPRLASAGHSSTLKSETSLFTGRAEQIRMFEKVLDDVADAGDLRQIFAVHGMPGVGKTTLATHLANRAVVTLAQRLKEPLMARHVDLRGFGGAGRTDPVQKLQELFLLDGVPPTKIPRSLDGLQAAWRSHLTGTFAVLLLDDAGDEEQVTPFLPGNSGHLVIVTSRRPLPLASSGPTPIHLPIMDQDDARQLIRALARRPDVENAVEARAVAEIAEICGNHPQAMILAVTGLATKPEVSFSTRSSQLKSVPNRLLAIDEYANGEGSQVTRSFELSYAQLPEPRRHMLRRLSLSPVPEISIEVAAALTGSSTSSAAGHLRRLEGEGLIAEENQRYRLHDLVRDYARLLADQDDDSDNHDAVMRVLELYYATALSADAALTRQPPPDAHDRLPEPAAHSFANLAAAVAWAREERENLLICAEYVEVHSAGPGSRIPRAWVTRYASATAGILRNEGLWPQSIQLQTRAIAAAMELDLPIAQANALHERGQLNRLVGDPISATDDLERALSLFRQIGGDAGATGEGHALNTLGVVMDQRGNYEQARGLLAASLAAYRASGDRLGEANVLHAEGVACHYAKQYDEAVRLLGRSLNLYQQVGHPLGQAHAHSHLARNQRLIGLPGARENLESAQDLYGQLGNLLGEATSLQDLGSLLRPRLGAAQVEGADPVRAQWALERARERYRQLGNVLGVASTSAELGALHGATGDLVLAKVHLYEAVRLFREAGLQRDERSVLEEIERLGLPPV